MFANLSKKIPCRSILLPRRLSADREYHPRGSKNRDDILSAGSSNFSKSQIPNVVASEAKQSPNFQAFFYFAMRLLTCTAFVNFPSRNNNFPAS
jgi:hypothetical protein